VDNTGKDWIRVGRYELDAACPTPPVRVLSLRGKRTILVWAWNETHAWYQPVYGTAKLALRDVAVTLGGLAPGRYQVRRFDPWSGQWGVDAAATVGPDGTATLRLGDLAADTALRLSLP